MAAKIYASPPLDVLRCSFRSRGVPWFSERGLQVFESFLELEYPEAGLFVLAQGEPLGLAV